MDVDQERPSHYTVYARDTPFRLTRSQIEYDSPNYFTSAFLSHDFAESSSCVIRTDRNPQLFALIVEHLSGYAILPLQPSTFPPWMSIELAKENLLRDARYFGLEQLQEAILAPKPTIVDLPEAISSVLAIEKVYPLERVMVGGDLILDTKIYRPFVSADPLHLADDPSNVCFSIRNVPMRIIFSTYWDGTDPDHVEKELFMYPKYSDVGEKWQLQASQGTVGLNWSFPKNSTNNAFKLNNEVFTVDSLSDTLDQLKTGDQQRVIFQHGSIKTPLQFEQGQADELCMDVVAEYLVLSLKSSTREDGFYNRAEANLIYAEFKTTEEWTRSVAEPAFAAVRGK